MRRNVFRPRPLGLFLLSAARLTRCDCCAVTCRVVFFESCRGGSCCCVMMSCVASCKMLYDCVVSCRVFKSRPLLSAARLPCCDCCVVLCRVGCSMLLINNRESVSVSVVTVLLFASRVVVLCHVRSGRVG